MAAIVLLAGCGGGDSTGSSPQQTQPPASQPASSAPDSTPPPGSTPALTSASPDIDRCPVDLMAPCSAFQTPSRNISCFVTSDGGGYIRCDIASGLNPLPTGSCEFDWLGMSAPAAGKAEPTCGSDALPTAGVDIPVLEYDTVWKRYGLRCVSRTAGLRCANAEGHGFFLSRERWSAF
jgi:hypothetical protein